MVKDWLSKVIVEEGLFLNLFHQNLLEEVFLWSFDGDHITSSRMWGYEASGMQHIDGAKETFILSGSQNAGQFRRSGRAPKVTAEWHGDGEPPHSHLQPRSTNRNRERERPEKPEEQGLVWPGESEWKVMSAATIGHTGTAIHNKHINAKWLLIWHLDRRSDIPRPLNLTLPNLPSRRELGLSSVHPMSSGWQDTKD